MTTAADRVRRAIEADRGLYRAKERGRKTTFRYTDDERAAIADDLEPAITGPLEPAV